MNVFLHVVFILGTGTARTEYKKNMGMFVTNFKRGRGDNMGVSGFL